MSIISQSLQGRRKKKMDVRPPHLTRLRVNFVLRLALIVFLGLSFSLWSDIVPVSAATSSIDSGIPWSDSSGKIIQAHGGGITKVGSTYYWFGEDKTSGAVFQNVTCYSSSDLIHWSFVSNVLTQQASGDLGPNRIIERPKVLYNDSTHQYVMYMHVDSSDYADARVGVATSSSICGSYSYRGSFRPLGYQSRDMGLFKDDDGSGYLLTEDRANGLRIDKLSADYLSVASSVALFGSYEAPALFKQSGRYYLLGSHLTGWNTNDNQYTTSTSLSGSWSAWANFAPTGSNTHNSQTTFVLPVTGSSGSTAIYLGDRWVPSSLANSTYIWLPLQVSGTSLSLAWHSSWSISASAGTWQDQGTPYYKLVNRNSGKVLDVTSSSTADGAKITQWTDNGGTNQQWNIVSTSTGYYKLINRNSGKVVDVTSSSTADGASVIQWGDNSGTNQQWSLTSTGGGLYYKLVNRNSGKVLDVTSSSTADGASMVQWTDNGGNNQQWRLVKV
jgi:hypothetical protein